VFITNRQAEVKGSQVMLEPGHQGWHFVQQDLISPWFHTTVVRCENSLEFHDVVFVDSLQALTPLLELTEAGVQVKSVRLVSPGWLNGTGDWHMDTLLEIARNQDGTSLRYTLHDGRHFYFPEAQPDTSGGYSVLLFPTQEDDGS